MRYFEEATEEVAEASGFARTHTLHRKVESIRSNAEIGVKYMNAMEEKLLERQAGAEESELAAIANLMKNKGWTMEEAMDVIEVAEEKRNRYIEKLTDISL